jgi:GTP cyclohydrolase I
MPIDREAAKNAIAAFLAALGHEASAPELAETPARVVDAFENDLLSGYGVDVGGLLAAESTFLAQGGSRTLVVVRDVSVVTLCPHHLLPGLGSATVGYLPGDRLVGIGTIARVVDAFARRLTLQETIGESVVQALVEQGGARGAVCRLTVSHSCLAARGARQTAATVMTFAALGEAMDPVLLGGSGA